MPVNDDELRKEFISIRDDAVVFLEAAEAEAGDKAKWQVGGWDDVLPQGEAMAADLRKRLIAFGPRLLDAARSSPLLEDTDEVELRRSLRGLSSNLFLQDIVYSRPYVINDEDRVLGFSPAHQEESQISLSTATANFKREGQTILNKMDFLAPTVDGATRRVMEARGPEVRRYVPNTAFIMMQIDKNDPALEDVNNTIKEVFAEFKIKAIRSDEIEHADAITQRILTEIEQSEFHLADLTGERPSVYYEVGYAHAIGKRPILYRREGTRLHFDLSVHNVPEYRNMTDLKEKLRKRLVEITNQNPQEAAQSLKEKEERRQQECRNAVADTLRPQRDFGATMNDLCEHLKQFSRDEIRDALRYHEAQDMVRLSSAGERWIWTRSTVWPHDGGRGR